MEQSHHDDIRRLVERVRARWRTLVLVRAATRALAATGVVLALALLVSTALDRAPVALALTGASALVATVAAVAWGLAPLRHVPSNVRVARFIEERTPDLDDRLVSAVDVLDRSDDRSAKASGDGDLAESLLADAAARARSIDPAAIVPVQTLRRAGFHAAAFALLVCAIVFAGRSRARQAYDSASLALFPSRITLEVVPGNVRVKAGSPLAIEARLVGNRAPVNPEVQIAGRDEWRGTAMVPALEGRFRLALAQVTAPFKYRVIAGAVASPTYAVTVARAPRVTRIDVDYTFPPALGLTPRTEADSGDIYAPSGTDVRLHIHTDRPASDGRLALGGGKIIPLTSEAPATFAAEMKIVDDNSYRVALKDQEGLENPGDTEYFIRTLEDRPPEVHIIKPASDRAVTRLEEVEIEAQADDDYGIDRMELVYSVRGGPEKAVPLNVPRRATSVSAMHTLYLEELDVQPGDFVSYYARARDITRGKRQNEARSDIFFLEVRPFEQEFALAQSQSMAGAGYNGSIDDLVNAQKQVVVATWKLDRRAQNAKGARSEQDVRLVARTEADLKTRVEQTSSTFRESTMRDPRRPQRGRGGQPDPSLPSVGQPMPEEDAMAAASTAMGKAVTSLNELKTGDALPPELEALNHLLKAQADVKRRQVTRQQAGSGGPGNNNRNYDVSTLFDKELQRQQQSNYQTPPSAEQREDPSANTLDSIRDLARRLDELMKRQRDVARDRGGLDEEEFKRQLEQLTRDQMELRQRAEDLARQLTGQQKNAGQQSASSQGGASGEVANRLRDASEELRSATNDLRRQDTQQASARSTRALEKLREAERQFQASRPDERRRALGEMQLEARQLADAQRQVASELGKQPPGNASTDAMRRLAGDEDRLADRVRKLQDGLDGLNRPATPAAAGGGQNKEKSGQASVGEAARDLQQQRLAERMQKSADDMRGNSADKPGGSKASPPDPRAQSAAQTELARALDKVADKLAAARGSKEADAGKLSDQLARAQDLRDRLNSLSQEIQRLGQANQTGGAAAQKTPGDKGRSGVGQAGGGSPHGTDLAKLRDEYARQLREAQSLLDQMRRDDPTFTQGGAGFTFEGQGMTLSAPGTEAFKQDFAKWEELRRQATQALDRAQSSLSKKLQAQEAKDAKDRLASGVDDKAPPEYQKQVDSYFKALAKKKP